MGSSRMPKERSSSPLVGNRCQSIWLYSFIRSVGEGFYKMPELLDNTRLEVTDGFFATLAESEFYQAYYREDIG